MAMENPRTKGASTKALEIMETTAGELSSLFHFQVG